MGSISRFFSPPTRSFFLFGPRGTGKSTWIKTHLKDALYIDLLQAGAQREYHINPDHLKEIVSVHPSNKIIVIDEIQKVPELLTVVHSLIEEKKGRRFVLTGSSARKIKQTGVDLLGGRASVETLHPFMAAELGDQFNFARALQFGLLPLVWADPEPLEALKGYVDLYLKEEVLQEGILRNLGVFSHFLEAMTFSHGGLLNLSNIARECHVDQKTVASYVKILEDLLLSFRLPIFTKRAKRETSQHPKFYFFDTGVFRSLRPTGPLDRPSEIDGQALEGLVAQHLRAWMAYEGGRHTLYFWRTRSGVEVDFVVYGPNQFWAIEVKNSARLRGEDTKGLRTFLTDYPEAKAVVVYRGKEKFLQKNLLCIPCEEFLLQMSPGHSLA